jgi:hypothetical protein
MVVAWDTKWCGMGWGGEYPVPQWSQGCQGKYQVVRDGVGGWW